MNRFVRMRRLRASCCCALLVSGLASPAEPADANAPATKPAVEDLRPGHLSLAEAQSISFERNWDLLAAKSGIDLASAQLIVTKEFPNPNFSFTSARIDPHGNGTPLGNSIWDRSYDTIFTISQLIEIAGKRHDRQISARAGITSARARFYDARRALDQALTKAYIAALLADENTRILDESARSLRREADIAETRFKAGDISASDLKQIQNNADVFDLQAKSAEMASVQARIAVEVLMGLPGPKGTWLPADSLEKLSAIVPPEPFNLGGAGARPDVLAAEADVSKAQADLALQRALRVPDPTFSIFYERNPPTPPGPDTMGIGVSFPLPLWNHNRGNIRAAEAATEQSALTLGKVKAQAEADLSNSEVAYQEATQRLLRYQKQIRPRSANVREAVAFAYSKGGASLVDLLTAERDDNTVRLATAQALSDAASAAADLKAARTIVSKSQLSSYP